MEPSFERSLINMFLTVRCQVLGCASICQHDSYSICTGPTLVEWVSSFQMFPGYLWKAWAPRPRGALEWWWAVGGQDIAQLGRSFLVGSPDLCCQMQPVLAIFASKPARTLPKHSNRHSRLLVVMITRRSTQPSPRLVALQINSVTVGKGQGWSRMVKVCLSMSRLSFKMFQRFSDCPGGWKEFWHGRPSISRLSWTVYGALWIAKSDTLCSVRERECVILSQSFKSARQKSKSIQKWRLWLLARSFWWRPWRPAKKLLHDCQRSIFVILLAADVLPFASLKRIWMDLHGFAIICPLLFPKGPQSHRLIHVTDLPRGTACRPSWVETRCTRRRQWVILICTLAYLCLTMDITDFCLRGAASP